MNLNKRVGSMKVEERNPKRFRSTTRTLFDLLPYDAIAHIASYAQHGIERRSASNALELLRAGGSLASGSKLSFLKWTEKLEYAFLRRRRCLPNYLHQMAENVDGLYLSTRGNREFKMVREIASMIGKDVFQLTIYASILSFRYVRFVRSHLPNIRRLIVCGNLYCKSRKFSALLKVIPQLDYLELVDVGCPCGWLLPLASRINDIEKLRLETNSIWEYFMGDKTLAVVWSAVDNNCRLKEVEISAKYPVDCPLLRLDMLKTLPGVRYAID